ncbi:hypothetical protein LJR030_002038 [Rhizobium sp. LjRoot30]|uniref:hypothetical protein n=1 Tax=Rhizobium sp. LjRoot30 TaxID=3342320 RepID=UPI003ECCF13F
MSNVINFYDAERQILPPDQATLTSMRLLRNSLQALQLEMDGVLSKLIAANEAADEMAAQESELAPKNARSR